MMKTPLKNRLRIITFVWIFSNYIAAVYAVTAINSPTNGQVLANIYNNGSFDFPVNITVNDPNLSSWVLKY
jgi:propanediol dehydratase large subunit